MIESFEYFAELTVYVSTLKKTLIYEIIDFELL